MNAHAAIAAVPYAPKPEELRAHLGVIASSLQDALQGLALNPSPMRAGMVAIQLAGAHQLVCRFREAMARESIGSTPDGDQ
jgi:hypothetical protein